MPLSSALSSDFLLALSFPLVILVLAYRISPSSFWSQLKAIFSLNYPVQSDPWAKENAYISFRRYRPLATAKLSQMRASYGSLGRAHKRIAYELGYAAKLNALQDIIQANALVTDAIAELAGPVGPVDTNAADFSKVLETLKHFVRDWSDEGMEERTKTFGPIFDVLRDAPRGRVLVPGAGLCRLAWEISKLGHDVTANEISPYMNLAFELLLKRTKVPNEHTIHPYAHWFSHQRSNSALFRSVQFPDVVPVLNENFHLSQGDFLTLPTETETPFDYVVTLFFIDTSINVIATLERVHTLLRPGGLWINLGPLLWTSGAQAKLELSLDEVVRSTEHVGFRILDGKDDIAMEPRTVPCEYTSDKTAMMRWIYQAEFWVARKVEPNAP